MGNFVQSLRFEINAVEESIRTRPDPRVLKLQELKKVLALYVGEASVVHTAIVDGGVMSNMPRAGRVLAALGHKPGRKISPERQAAIEATIGILKQASGPLKTAALYEMISDMGVTIGGTDPVNNYSALLYGRDEFKSHGREGWTLKMNEGSNAGASEPS